MADPVIMDSYESALKAGRELERLGYRWLEEPLLDVNLNGLRKLREKLDIPICGTEVIAGAHYTTAHCIAEGIVDIVRTDVSWRGGITAVMKTAHVAEAFGVQCELHTTIYHGLEQVQLHPSLAIPNCEFFETLYRPNLHQNYLHSVTPNGYARNRGVFIYQYNTFESH